MWPSTDTPGPWFPYRVGDPSKSPHWTNPSCVPLKMVFHVAHLEAARRILVDRSIRAGLVFDESRLNTQRVRVVWLSPNSWSQGSIYGNVRFTFDWSWIIRDFQAYWVETMEQYNPTACRILLTKKDYTDTLLRYDPSGKDGVGPWWYDEDSDTHYWNSKYTLEIMLEDDIELSGAQKIDFVTHHPRICSAFRAACTERGQSEHEAGARFIAATVADGVSVPPDLLTELQQGQRNPSPALKSAAQTIWADLNTITFTNTSQLPEEAKLPLARAILHAWAHQNPGEAHALAGFFGAKEDMLRYAAIAVQERFGIASEADLDWRAWI